jgi:hypothetical protein
MRLAISSSWALLSLTWTRLTGSFLPAWELGINPGGAVEKAGIEDSELHI